MWHQQPALVHVHTHTHSPERLSQVATVWAASNGCFGDLWTFNFWPYFHLKTGLTCVCVDDGELSWDECWNVCDEEMKAISLWIPGFHFLFLEVWTCYRLTLHHLPTSKQHFDPENLPSCKHICWNQISAYKLDSLCMEPFVILISCKQTKQKPRLKKTRTTFVMLDRILAHVWVDVSLQSWK